MLTKNDLTDAIKPIIKTLTELTAGQKELLAGQKMLSLRQRAQGMELKTLQAEVEQLDNKIEKKFDQQGATIAGFFHETWTALDKLERKTEERIQKIEAHTGLPHS